MFPLATTMSGLATGFPDVCKTPSPAGLVPIPYPNIGELMMADPATCAENVLVLGMPALVEGSEITVTEGDEAGVGGGIVSMTVSGPGTVMLGSFTVSLGGRPAAYLTSMVGLNGINANCPLGVHAEPSQEQVTVGP